MFVSVWGWEFCLASGGGLAHFGEKGSNLFEKLLDIDASFSTDFLEEDVVVLGHLPTLVLADISILKINFVCQ